MGYSKCGMFGLWIVWNLGCSVYGMFMMWSVWDKGCWGSGMFRIKDGGWGMFARIMDVDLERNRGH